MGISEQDIKDIAQLCADLCFRITKRQIDPSIALEVSKQAGNAMGNTLDRSLREHGIRIESAM